MILFLFYWGILVPWINFFHGQTEINVSTRKIRSTGRDLQFRGLKIYNRRWEREIYLDRIMCTLPKSGALKVINRVMRTAETLTLGHVRIFENTSVSRESHLTTSTEWFDWLKKHSWRTGRTNEGPRKMERGAPSHPQSKQFVTAFEKFCDKFIQLL